VFTVTLRIEKEGLKEGVNYQLKLGVYQFLGSHKALAVLSWKKET